MEEIIGKYSIEVLMSRPKPTILIENLDQKIRKKQQIIATEGLWIVLYKNQPFNFKTERFNMNGTVPKYKKTCFPNPGHAYRLAKKLNNIFNCDDFSVRKIL